jgi:hypothetical protein
MERRLAAVTHTHVSISDISLIKLFICTSITFFFIKMHTQTLWTKQNNIRI